MLAENCPFGTMKTIGYKNIAQKYYQRTNLRHTVKKFEKQTFNMQDPMDFL
jgi:hypothetical protein